MPLAEFTDFNPTPIFTSTEHLERPTLTVFKKIVYMAFREGGSIRIRSAPETADLTESQNWTDVTSITDVGDGRKPTHGPGIAASESFLFLVTTGSGHTNLSLGISSDGIHWDFLGVSHSGTKSVSSAAWLPETGAFVTAWQHESGNGSGLYLYPQPDKNPSDWPQKRFHNNLSMGTGGNLAASPSQVLLASKRDDSKNADYIWNFDSNYKGAIHHMDTELAPAVAYNSNTGFFHMVYRDDKDGGITKFALARPLENFTTLNYSNYQIPSQPSMCFVQGQLVYTDYITQNDDKAPFAIRIAPFNAFDLTLTKTNYLSLLGAKETAIGVDERITAIKNCMPIWILAEKEDYYPKALQTYKEYDVRALSVNNDGSGDLMPYEDLSYQKKNGKNNHMKVADNLLSQTLDLGKEHNGLTGIYPRATPTYVLFHETVQETYWIRYFLFFGYNDIPKSPLNFGKHYGDWVHIAVEINKSMVPQRYYFSQHDSGKEYKASDKKLDFYISEHEGLKFKEVNFTDLPKGGPYHVGVFCALGTHECYADTGTHVGWHYPDITSYGDVVIPFAVGYGQKDKPPLRTNSKFTFSPVYAWDMSDPTQVEGIIDDPDWIITANNAPFVLFKPKLLLPDWGEGTKEGGDFEKLWVTKAADYPESVNTGQNINRPISACGQKVGGGATATSPAVKVFDWGDNFEE